MDWPAIRSFIIRHRFAIRDLGLVLAAVAALAYCAFAFDLFENEDGLTVHKAEIELDEALLLGVVLALGLLLFGARQYLRQKREMARRLSAEGEVRKLAYQDVLTGLPNRRRFDDALAAALGAPPRAGASHAVLLLDLNGFKAINDVHGHAAGDELLLVENGTASASEMFAHAARDNNLLGWIIRAAGLFLLAVGFTMVMEPIGVIADVVPLMGDIVRLGTGLAALVFTVLVGGGVIAIAWFYYRPVVAICVLAGCAALAFALVRYRKGRAGARPGPSVPDPMPAP